MTAVKFKEYSLWCVYVIFMVIYRKEQGFTNLAHYTDDGDSGTLFWMKYLQILCIYLTYANATIYNCLYLG